MTNPKFSKIGIITKRNIHEHKDLLKKLVAYLKKKKKQIILDENAAAVFGEKGFRKTDLLKKADMSIILGGDGTLLKTARRLPSPKTYVLSVNLGTLGFLTECNAENLFEALDIIFKGKYELDKRSVLRVTVYREKQKIETYLALNDAVINQGAFARLIKLDLKIGDKNLVTFRADGMVVATPTGSTAHSLSAGGPIIHPKIEGLVITPICPNSLAMRPIVIPDTRELTVTIDTERREETAIIGLTLDGQDMSILKYGDQIKFRKSKRHLYLLRTGNRYYQMLRTKLKWGL
jgi:NAD+ kinase